VTFSFRSGSMCLASGRDKGGGIAREAGVDAWGKPTDVPLKRLGDVRTLIWRRSGSDTEKAILGQRHCRNRQQSCVSSLYRRGIDSQPRRPTGKESQDRNLL